MFKEKNEELFENTLQESYLSILLSHVNKRIVTMQEFSGLNMRDGRPIRTSEFVEELRQEEGNNKYSKVFIPNKGAQEDGLHSDADLIIYGGNRGGGKANPYSTMVATPTGFRKMGELQVGDPVCTPYEGIQEVTEIFEHGEQTIYTLHFDDGTTVKCMDNHRFYARSHPDEPFMVWEARDIFDIYRMDERPPYSLKRGQYDYVEFPLCGEVEHEEYKVPGLMPIHPLLLGYIVGKGTWDLSVRGVPIKSRFYGYPFYREGYFSKRDINGNYRVVGINNEARMAVTAAKNGSPAYIPHEYQYASVETRLNFVKGVLFRNGYSKSMCPYVEFPNKRLAEQLAQMVRSLGCFVMVVENTTDPDKIGYYRVSIKAPDAKKLWESVCRRNRAKIIAPIPKSIKELDGCLTKKVLWVSKDKPKQKCRCITISGNEHLYLTDAYTINHNTALMLMEGAYDITKKHSHSVLFRKNKDDFVNIENESSRWFANLGRYNKSKDDMTWNFYTGAKMSFDHFDMTLKEFEDKYRGQQYPYIGIDELPQIPFEFVKILMGSNRNTVGIRSRILGTCNPDPLSWLRKFVDWWIADKDTVYPDGEKHPERHGLPIPWRNGVVRYFFITGDSVDNIVWGNTPEEVYEQAKEEIDASWDPKLQDFGYDKMSFAVKSAVFIKASIMENKALLMNDPNYIASILNKSPEERAKEWEGNWDAIAVGDDLIQPYHLEKCFSNAAMMGDHVRRASCDVAGDGGDNCVTWLKIGNHVQDLYVCRVDPYNTVPLIKAKLREWGVLEQNFVYDLQGIGQIFKGAFPNAVPFNNQEAVAREDRNLYDCMKSQCAYKFAQHTQQGEWSIEPTLLKRQFKSGRATNDLQFILQRERKAIRQDMSKVDKGWCLIPKDTMKRRSLVGHSPDFIEALCMFEIFDVKESDTEVPEFLRKHVRSIRTFSFS